MEKLSLTSKLIALVVSLLLTACSNEPATGPVDVTWDRDMCERCVMALSDRNHGAEVRDSSGKRSKVYKFDDIGCAVLWLEEQPWKDNPKTEIWVNDYKTGAWLNAKVANFIKITHTPMDYGHSATLENHPEAVKFTRMKELVFEKEAEYHEAALKRIEELKNKGKK